MEVVGTVVIIYSKNQISEKFAKRDIVIETAEDYPQQLIIQFVQDKCGLLDGFSEGELVKIKVNLRGREWISPDGNVKYFNTIQGWQIESDEPYHYDKDPDGQTETFAKTEADKMFKEEIIKDIGSDSDDLPF